MGEPRARVLVVDDEFFFREAIRDILSAEGFEVVEAVEGEAGLELAEDPSVGIVILDIRLPGIDGLEVLRRVRGKRPGLRVIMLSAHTDQELVLDALRLGACDYLAKPLHDEELVLAVQRAADGFALSEDWGRLRSRLDRMIDQLEALGRRAEGCDDAERQSVIAQSAAEVAADVLEASRTSLMLLDEARQELRVAATVGQTILPAEMDAVALGEGVAGVACERAQALLVNDAEGDVRFGGRVPDERYESNSFAVAPLTIGERRLGVLCATERAGGGGFGEEDLGLLRLLAMQVSEIFARQGGSAEGALAEPAKRLEPAVAGGDDDGELVRLVCEAITSEGQPERVFDAALSPIVERLAAAPASIFLIDNEDGDLRCEATCDGGLRADRKELDGERGLTGAVLRSGRMVATDTPQADIRFDAQVDTPEDGVAGPLLCVPLSLRGKVVGVFRAFPSEGAAVWARAGEILGTALSAAVRNALLYRSLLESIEEVAEVRRTTRR